VTDNTIQTATDWEARYRAGEDRWTMDVAPPALRDLLAALRPGGHLSVLVPGAGYGVDALAWAQAGHEVTAIDIAPYAVAGMTRRARQMQLELTVREADLFDLPSNWRGRFDAIWEQTCYCAIRPERRAEYVRAMAAVLKPAGVFYGLFWNHGVADGPPWSISMQEVRERFGECFSITALDAVSKSLPPRAQEFLARMLPLTGEPARP